MLLLGGAMTASQDLRAQQKPMPVIGYLPTGRHVRSNSLMAAFRQGLGETGYVEGQNVEIEFRPAQGRYDQLPMLAADLVARKVDVIAAFSIPAALAAKNATSTIPIVFSIGADPVEFGLVASLARPGGNLTGVSALLVDLTAKRFDLLSQLVPKAKGIALLLNSNNPNSERVIRDAQEAGRAKGRLRRRPGLAGSARAAAGNSRGNCPGPPAAPRRTRPHRRPPAAGWRLSPGRWSWCGPRRAGRSRTTLPRASGTRASRRAG